MLLSRAVLFYLFWHFCQVRHRKWGRMRGQTQTGDRVCVLMNFWLILSEETTAHLILCFFYGFVGLRDPRQQFLVIFLTFLCCRSLSRLKGVLLWKLAGFFMPLRRQTSFWRCCCQKWTQHVFPVDQSHFWSHGRCPERLQSAPEALSQREHNADAPGGISGLDCIFFCEGSKAKKVENHWCNLWRCIFICYVC